MTASILGKVLWELLLSEIWLLNEKVNFKIITVILTPTSHETNIITYNFSEILKLWTVLFTNENPREISQKLFSAEPFLTKKGFSWIQLLVFLTICAVVVVPP